jgi:rhomboid protease GluP
VVVRAVQRLRWRIISASGNTLRCYTARRTSFGELVTIAVQSGTISFRSVPDNEYYWVDNQNKRNAENLRRAIAVVIEHDRKAERNRPPVAREKYGALVPSKTYMVTPILIYLNVLVFLLMMAMGVNPVTPDTRDLLAAGGNFMPLTTTGQWWRLFTYMFLHAGIAHIAMNMFALVYIGMFLEPLLGRLRLTAAYIATGICAGLLSTAMHAYSVGVGASGAIFGLYGIFLALLTTSHIEKAARNTMLRSILFFVVFNLMMGLQGNTDNAAHIGGLLSGLAIGYMYYPGVAGYHNIKRQAGMVTLTAVLVVLLTAFVLPRIKTDTSVYASKMHEFGANETVALEAYSTIQNMPAKEALRILNDRGIAYWQKDVTILKEISRMDMPARLRQKNTDLKEYCRLRIHQYNMKAMEIDHGGTAYEATIKADSIAIAHLLSEITGD